MMRTCSVEGCDARHKGKGYCYKHLRRWNKYGSTDLPPKPAPKTCSIVDCGKPVLARGWCTKHYSRWRTYGDPIHPPQVSGPKPQPPKFCSVEGCGREHEARGKCRYHYSQERKEGMPTCYIDGCEQKACDSRGWCSTHYTRWRKYGNPTYIKPHHKRKPRKRKERWMDSGGYAVVKRGNRIIPEHRWVMEQHIGRRLRREETVHHLNGDKLDNRLENLELWASNHPPGQRVQDKVDYAVEILERYAPEKLRKSECLQSSTSFLKPRRQPPIKVSLSQSPLPIR